MGYSGGRSWEERMTRVLVLLGLALGLSAPLGRSVGAADFPSAPVRMIVPWPAGGTTDLVMRAFNDMAGKALGGQVVSDNKPGATGTLGAVALTSAKPDGYILTQMPITAYRQPFLTKTAFDPL